MLVVEYHAAHLSENAADVHVGDVLVAFKRVWVGAASYVVGQFDDVAHPLAAQMLRAMPQSFAVLREGHPVFSPPPGLTLAAAPPAVTPALPLVPTSGVAAAPDTSIVDVLRGRARTLGWSDEDLVGTGGTNGSGTPDPGPAGGCSTRSGLSLAAMVLCVPPPRWEAQSATAYPWELPGWRAPGVDWTPPRAIRKAQPEKVIEPPATSTIVNEPVPLEDEVEDDAPVDDAPPPPPADPAALASYGAPPAVDKAREILSALTVKGNGVPPGLSKANHHLSRGGLPRATEPQLVALLGT